MRGRLSGILMLFVALSLVLSLVATVAPVASAQGGTIIPGGPTGGLNKWVRHDLPTTQHWQMAPNTDIWDLTAADDGTLFALVEDTSGAVDMMGTPGTPTWDGLRWAVFPAYSDVALMKSTDGGYEWEIMWHQPASDVGAPIAVVPQPGYVDGDSANDVVFVATGTRYHPVWGPGGFAGGQRQGNIYRSFDGGDTFTRVTPRNPAVTLGANSGTITSLDVAENVGAPGTYLALVGVSGMNGVGRGEGVYTWNEDNDRDWQDKQISNAMPPAPFPGTMPAGRGLDVMAVKASDSYTEDQIFMALVSDTIFGGAGDPAGMDVGVYFCFWDGNDGSWGGDIDSPTNAAIGPIPGPYARYAVIETADDFSNGNNVFVGIDGSPVDDVYRIAGRPTVTGPSLVQARGLGSVRISDMQFIGSAGSGALYVAGEAPLGSPLFPVGEGQAQVFRGEAMTLWPTWTPSYKPPSGGWPTFVTLMGDTLMAAGGGDGWTYGGVHRCAAGCTCCAAGQRMVFNGVGLLDDIAVTEDIPGYVNPGTYSPLMLGTSWCMAEAHAEEVSPSYETDNLMYVATYSMWDADAQLGPSGPAPGANLSLWRWTDSAHWERVLKEFVTMPVAGPAGVGNAQYRGKMWLLSGLAITTSTVNTWWPRVSDGFSEDPYVFLLGGRGDSQPVAVGNVWWQEMFWYSEDLGDTWKWMNQMPIGAATGGPPGIPGLSEAGWWVEDNSILFAGDTMGWVYKTTDRGESWTEGALTAAGIEVTSIITSPIYSETGSSDKCVLVGTFDPSLPGGVLGGSDVKHEVWLSQDGCVQDLENVGAEICSAPLWTAPIAGSTIALLSGYGFTVVNFDPGWETNRMAYSTASTWLDLWELVGPGATQLTRIDTTDVGVYRSAVNLNEPSASTWEQVWDADDFNSIAPNPQPIEGMLPTWITFRWALISDLQIGKDGTMYVPFGVYDFSRNYDANSLTGLDRPPSPNGPGRFTAGGVLRSLEPTQKAIEWNVVDGGLGEWDALFLNRAPVGNSNTLISLAWDFQEWRWKLAILDDTLCTEASPTMPKTGDNGVGTLANNKVSVDLQWGQMDADVYEWQLDDDCGFVEPLIASGVTSEELVTVTGLEPDVSYCWRARATDPYWSRWSPAQQFNTVIGTERNAPQLLVPAPGSVIADTTPTFQWTAIGWADKYQLQVATGSAFGSADMVINENLGDVQAYLSSDMAEGTYYWRVKASSGISETAWSSTGVFTISSEAAAGGGTAAWVWVVIIIGILLLILVVAFIMRTRQAV
jgi:hypothetical protein